MEPIRILHENVELNPGGIESLLMNIYRNIDREKVQFDFLLHRPYEGCYEKEVLEMGGKIYKTPAFNPFKMRRFNNSIEKVLREHPEYKVIHAHSELNYWPLKIAKKVGLPTRIAHSHNAKTVVNLKYFFFLYEKIFIKKYCTDMFMCSTPAGVWTFGEKAVKSNKAVFIKNGIEVDKYRYNESIRNDVRKEFGLDNKFVIGHVGRFMQQKNHDFLLDIFKSIHDKRQDSVLVLIGDGRLMDDVKNKINELGLTDSVIILGHRSDVNRLMQGFDLFLLPSLWEGLPVTGIEAQSAGLPIIMSDVITKEVNVTGNIDYISLNSSAEFWADSVLNKFSTFERKDTSQQVIDSGFDIKTTAKWLEDFYLKCYFDNKDII